MKGTSVVIAGAGITGLAAAQQLKSDNISFQLLEASPSVGGLTRSQIIGGYCFDYTGHLLHLARRNSPWELFPQLNWGQWRSIQRNAKVFFAGRLIDAPFQYNLSQLPEEIRNECIMDFKNRDQKADTLNLTDYFRSSFGNSISKYFLEPYNQKLFGVNLERMGVDAIKRFFPTPIPERVLGIEKPAEAVPGQIAYNSQFWYPEEGGIGHLVSVLSQGISASVNQEITEIDLSQQRLKLANGNSLRYERLISSLPLKTLCFLTGDQHLVNLAKPLEISRTLSWNLGIKGSLQDHYRNIHWVYYPETEVPFHRIGFYSAFSDNMCPSDRISMYIEVGSEMGNHETYRSEILRYLHQIMTPGFNVEVMTEYSIDNSYVRFLPDTINRANAIREYLKMKNVHSTGRYGSWDYTSMEDSMDDGITTARAMLK